MDNKTNIVVSIATYNRPAGLEAVLNGLEELNVPQDIALRVLITDNSEDGNAREYIEKRIRDGFIFPLTYYHETERGITFPRNRGIEDALNQDDEYIAITDDDVLLDKDWLKELYTVAVETQAAAVIGAVKANFLQKPPNWIADGGYVEVVHFPDRQHIDYGHTTNVLIRLDVIRNLDLRFDPFFALAGGEDTAFFKTIRDHGGKTVFAKNAVVYECIGPERMKLTWWMKRWFRTGNTEGILETQAEQGSWKVVLRVLSRGVFRTFLGAAGSVVTLPTRLIGRVDSYDFLRIMCRGIGFISAVFGYTYQEYRNHDR